MKDNIEAPGVLNELRTFINGIVDTRLKELGALKPVLDPRGLRVSKGRELGDLALLARVSRVTLSRLETGRIRRPKPETLARIAAALEIPAAEYRNAVALLIQTERS